MNLEETINFINEFKSENPEADKSVIQKVWMKGHPPRGCVACLSQTILQSAFLKLRQAFF